LPPSWMSCDLRGSFLRREVLYVDDRAMHLRRVMAAVGPIHTLEMGRDITELKQVLDFIKFPRWDGSGC
jgi:predicted phosphatase